MARQYIPIRSEYFRKSVSSDGKSLLLCRKGALVVHRFENNGYFIILDVNSGCIHVVDELVYTLLPIVEEALDKGLEDDAKIGEFVSTKMGGQWDEESMKEAVDEMLQLRNEDMLFTKDIYEEYIGEFQNRETVVKALCLHIAHDCNLRCKYCFAEEGEYHGRRALMSLDVGKKALDFLIKNSGNRVNLEVDFFGGEPLMNWQVVKELVEYGRSKEEEFHKKFRFTLTTNGILLDEEIMEFLNKEMANLVLSIDGRKHVHDAMRPLRGGQGSYEKIVSKFLKAAISREQKNYYVRGTYTRHNLDFSKDVLHLADLGFGQISVEPVVADEGEGYALKEEDIPTLFQEYDVLAKEMIKRERQGRGFHFFHFMLDLEGGPCVAKRLSGCGSGTEYLAVTPWGDLYPCHQFVGQEEYLMGNVEEGIFKTDIVEEFKGCSVYSKEKCRNCFAKFYCSGGCAANSKRFHETIHEVYDIGCQLQRKRVECAIMIKAAMEEEGNGKYD